MKFLGLDTTRKRANIFIFDEERDLKYSLAMDENVKHSEGLFLYVEKALFECGMKIDDFDYYACVVGPGSFTGIRVGMATIKGFNKVAGKTIVPVNTFELLADSCKKSVILLNSTNTSCYYAKVVNRAIVETGVVLKEEILKSFEGFEMLVLKEEQNSINLEYNKIRVVET